MDRKDASELYRFAIEIDGLERAVFRDCSGLSAPTTDTVSVRPDEDENLPSPHQAQPMGGFSIVLRRGRARDAYLREWHKTTLEGAIVRKEGSIVLLHAIAGQRSRWTFVGGWPAKYDGPDMDATSTDVVIETLELTHEGVTTCP